MSKQRTMADLLSYAPPPPDTTGTADPAGAIAPSMVQGELRIRDLDLAVRLGFSRLTKIRDLIKRHQVSLLVTGPLPTVGRVINGGEATEYYLNCKQAVPRQL